VDVLLDAIIVGIVPAVNLVVIDEHLVISSAFKDFIFDLQLTLFSLDAAKESVVDNLCEVGKGVL
jgi:hypothetical protein